MSESSGVQDWRAVACLTPNGERLLCVGGSSAQVRAAYTNAWGEVIRDEDRPTVRTISLQRWAGLAWAGQWEHQTFLAVPSTRGGKAGAAEAAAETETETDKPETDLESELESLLDPDADLDADVETEDDAKVDADVEA
ncbi:hypothetical protein EP7_001166 [Isosphaeraceae bacterium EP7]